MNREIKFRAWDNKNKKLIYKVSVFESCAFFNNEHLPTLNGDRNYTIEQFTGLTDKDGNEIYEGDIFNCIYKEVCKKHIFVVEYIRDGFKLKSIGEKCLQNMVHQELSDVARYEILGNIHENPELINH